MLEMVESELQFALTGEIGQPQIKALAVAIISAGRPEIRPRRSGLMARRPVQMSRNYSAALYAEELLALGSTHCRFCRRDCEIA